MVLNLVQVKEVVMGLFSLIDDIIDYTINDMPSDIGNGIKDIVESTAEFIENILS